MTTLSGPLTPEKRTWIQEERAYMEDALQRAAEVNEKYENLEISVQEYMEMSRKVEYARTRQSLFCLIEDHEKYIDVMREAGHDAWFVYDTGWKTMILSAFNWPLYVAILLVCTGCFSMELEGGSSMGGFHQILRTTKKGRGKTVAAKLAASASIAGIMTVVWNAIEFMMLCRFYDLPLWYAPVHSIEVFVDWGADWTIGGYLVCMVGVRILAGMLLGTFACAASCVLKQQMAALMMVVLCTLLPSLLARLGMTLFAYVDYTNCMRATPVLLEGMAGACRIGSVLILHAVWMYTAERKWST